MKLKDLSKVLNDMFNNGEIDTDNFDFNGIELHVPDEYDGVEYEQQDECDENGYCRLTGHYDEQTLLNYLTATDEDGNWLHPYNREDDLL